MADLPAGKWGKQHRNFISVTRRKFRIGIDIDDLKIKWYLRLQVLQRKHHILAKMTRFPAVYDQFSRLIHI